MISEHDLSAIAKLKGLPIALAEVDYLQDIALMNVCREFGNNLVFKGGTCLYKIYQLNRFSEDLDFTATRNFRNEGFFSRLPYFFRLLNINTHIKIEKFENSLNVYLDCNGPLYQGRKETSRTVILNISFRERVILPALRPQYLPVYKEVRPFDIFAMDESEILAEKIRAIYTRKKARDVYDLWYLVKIKSIKPDISLIKRKLSHARIAFSQGTFTAKVEEKRRSWDSGLAALVSGNLPKFIQAKNEINSAMPW